MTTPTDTTATTNLTQDQIGKMLDDQIASRIKEIDALNAGNEVDAELLKSHNKKENVNQSDYNDNSFHNQTSTTDPVPGAPTVSPTVPNQQPIHFNNASGAFSYNDNNNNHDNVIDEDEENSLEQVNNQSSLSSSSTLSTSPSNETFANHSVPAASGSRLLPRLAIGLLFVFALGLILTGHGSPIGGAILSAIGVPAAVAPIVANVCTIVSVLFINLGLLLGLRELSTARKIGRKNTVITADLSSESLISDLDADNNMNQHNHTNNNNIDTAYSHDNDGIDNSSTGSYPHLLNPSLLSTTAIVINATLPTAVNSTAVIEPIVDNNVKQEQASTTSSSSTAPKLPFLLTRSTSDSNLLNKDPNPTTTQPLTP